MSSELVYYAVGGALSTVVIPLGCIALNAYLSTKPDSAFKRAAVAYLNSTPGQVQAALSVAQPGISHDELGKRIKLAIDTELAAARLAGQAAMPTIPSDEITKPSTPTSIRPPPAPTEFR